jgi:formaldehyde-activating enzyme
VRKSDLDGRVGQGWGGTAPDGSHVNVVLARRGSPAAAAALAAFASPSPGHTPVLVCVGPVPSAYEAVLPPTIMTNKATATEERHMSLTWGAAQLGIAQGVLDAVADGLLDADLDTIVLVAVWVDPAATDEDAVRDANRAAIRAAIGSAVEGPSAEAAQRLVDDRENLTNPYFGAA